MRWMSVLILCFLPNFLWAAAPQELTSQEKQQSYLQGLKIHMEEAKSAADYAEIELEKARQSLIELQAQKPVVVANNEPALESQLQTYEIAREARERAVGVAEHNAQQAQKEYAEAKKAYQRAL